MKKFQIILFNVGNALSFAILTFVILDYYNPKLEFMNNSYSTILIIVFTIVTIISNTIALSKLFKKKNKTK